MWRSCRVEREWRVGVSEFKRPIPPGFDREAARKLQAASSFTGLLSANFTFTIANTIAKASNAPAAAPILRGLQASLFGVDASGDFDAGSETDQATATLSGNLATCQVAIPYTWTLLVPAFDTVTIPGGATAVDSNGNGRTSSFQLDVIAAPSTGAITTLTCSGKL